MTTSNLRFEHYLRSLSTTYQNWWKLYTPTNTVNTPLSSSLGAFDFGLMAQAIWSQQPSKLPADVAVGTAPERFPVLSGLRKYAADHVLLVGRPGSGKSTALVRLLLEETARASDLRASGWEEGTSDSSLPAFLRRTGKIIPVLVELRYWQTSVLERIQAFLQRHDPLLTLDEIALKDLLHQGQLLLLLDGLNELPSAAARRQLAAFRQDFPRTPMVFTTRDVEAGDLGIKNKLEMQPLTDNQMRQFVQAYLPERENQLLRRLNSPLRQFGQTPLLLWMLCALYQQTETIPLNLALVLRQFTQSYDRCLKADVPLTDESRRWSAFLLQHLAFVMMQASSPTEMRLSISRQETLAALTHFLQGKVAHPADFALQCLDDLLKYHLIQSGDNNQVEFRHQLLQEYYAAEFLLQRLPQLGEDELKHNYLNSLKWTEAIALMLTLLEHQQQAVRIVQFALEVDLGLGARLAGAVRPESQPQTVDLILNLEIPPSLKRHLLGKTRSNEAIPPLLEELKDEDFRVRWSAAYQLGQLGSDAAIGGLEQALHDHESTVRQIAAYQLGQLGSDRAIPGLLRALNGSDSAVSWRVAEALEQLGSKEAIAGLLQQLPRRKEPLPRGYSYYEIGERVDPIALPGLLQLVSKQALSRDSGSWSTSRALEEIHTEAAIPTLLEALENQNPRIRSSAAKSLGKLGNRTVIPQLLQRLHDPDFFVRSNALEALGRLGNEATAPALIEALQDPDVHVCTSAIRALGELNSEAAISALVSMLQSPDLLLRRAATYELGKTRNLATIPALIKVLQHDQESGIRSTAAYALGEIGNETAISGLLEALRDEAVRVRESVVEALGKLGGKTALSALLDVLANEVEEASVRGNAIYALSKFKGEAARESITPEEKLLRVTGLTQALTYKDASLRSSAAKALGELGNRAAIPALKNALQDSNKFVRAHATESLAKLDCEAGIVALSQILENRDFDFTFQDAIQALGQWQSEAAIPVLTKVLEFSDGRTRSNAIQALGRISSEATVPALSAALESGEYAVYSEAAEFLGRLGSEAAIAALLQAVHNSKSSVRSSAVNALGKLNHTSVIPTLLQALQDPDPFVRQTSIKALGRSHSENNTDETLPTEALIAELLKVLKDENHHVQKRAAEAIAKIGSPAFLSQLWQMQLEAAETIALSAITAIQQTCQFYNYEAALACRTLFDQNSPEPSKEPPTIQMNFYGQVIGAVGNLEGNQIVSPQNQEG